MLDKVLGFVNQADLFQTSWLWFLDDIGNAGVFAAEFPSAGVRKMQRQARLLPVSGVRVSLYSLDVVVVNGTGLDVQAAAIGQEDLMDESTFRQ